MEKGYYKDPKTGKITKGSFEDAWKSFVDGFKEDEAQLDDEDEFPVPYDDEGIPLGENIEKIKETIKKILKNR